MSRRFGRSRSSDGVHGARTRLGEVAETVAGKSVSSCATFAHVRPAVAAAVIAAAVGAAWAACRLMGGSHNAGPHLFYVAIVLAAVRFSWPATAAVAVAAGLLAGPLLPADVALNIGQEPGAWMLRLSIFVLIGSFIALLVEDPEAALRNRRLEAIGAAGLLRALDTGEIEVFYQPICRVQDGRLAGVEALVRWRQPEGGYADPSTFIPIAERTGAISRLDEYVLRRAIATARDWASRAHPLYVSVNLSVTTLAGSWLVATIDRVLDETGLPPHLLQIEITESAVIDDLAGTIRQVAALRARGVKVAIDDFGSGHASLGYLQNLPVDVVKLDRSMVTAAAFDDRSHRMLEGVTRMCDLLGLQVIAEGVELPQQLACLSEMGVSMAQGYLLGPPAPPAEIRALIDGSVSP